MVVSPLASQPFSGEGGFPMGYPAAKPLSPSTGALSPGARGGALGGFGMKAPPSPATGTARAASVGVSHIASPRIGSPGHHHGGMQYGARRTPGGAAPTTPLSQQLHHHHHHRMSESASPALARLSSSRNLPAGSAGFAVGSSPASPLPPPSTPPRHGLNPSGSRAGRYSGHAGQPLSPLSPFSPEELRPGLRQAPRYADPSAGQADVGAELKYRQIRPPSLTSLGSGDLGTSCGYTSNSSSSSLADIDFTRVGSDGLLAGRGAAAPHPPQQCVSPPATPRRPAAPARPMTTYERMEAFTFGNPPSPTSKHGMRNAPPLGRPIKPTPDKSEAAETVMRRFANLVNELVGITGKKEPGNDLLPHLSPSEVVKQLVRRVNGFTDSGAARQVEDYRPVFAAFMRLIEVIFSRMGKSVRSSAIVDLLGSLFDMQLAYDYCRSWVSRAELRQMIDTVKSTADASVSFSALLLMVRQQCSHIDPSAGTGVDEDALAMCIAELLPIAKLAAKRHSRDPAVLLKEVYRFTDSHDSHWSAMKQRYSLSDPPHNPSPLGMLYYVVVHIVAYAGMTEVKHGMASLDAPASSRLSSVVEQAYRSLARERQRNQESQQKQQLQLQQQQAARSSAAASGATGCATPPSSSFSPSQRMGHALSARG